MHHDIETLAKAATENKNMIMWLLVSTSSGSASYINSVLNDSSIKFNFVRMVMRGFVGVVVGGTLAFIVDAQLGQAWGVPAASIGAWFATENMNILQKYVSGKLKPPTGE